MKAYLGALFLTLTFFISNAQAVIIDQDGISYSCTPIGSSNSGHCRNVCVKYCKEYKRYPFQNDCVQYGTQCGPNASVQTVCAEYKPYPFQDDCVQQEDVVDTDLSCN